MWNNDQRGKRKKVVKKVVFQSIIFFQFLAYTKAQGNDLSTPRGGFPGLKPGDRWALCAARWYEAYEAGFAPLIKLDATNEVAPYHMTRRNPEEVERVRNIVIKFDDNKSL